MSNTNTQTLVFATNNAHKVEEVAASLPQTWTVKSLQDIDCQEDIPETADTLQGNALLKAQFIRDRYGHDAFADDTGLEVDALNGAPGVYSARYAGEDPSFADNIEKLLRNLESQANRKARFHTVIALLLNGETHYFEGKVEGRILEDRQGEQGFGYDPIFQPEGYDRSFAEMSLAEKNTISHRGKAVKQLVGFLKEKVPS